MQKDPPHAIKTLTMSTQEAIEAETGFTKSELFTYYDQHHMTGVDISQDPETIGVVTMSEDTKIHEMLQGARLLRQLDFAQRIEMAIPKKALEKIESQLHRNFQKRAPQIRDLLLYAYVEEVKDQRNKPLVLLAEDGEYHAAIYPRQTLQDGRSCKRT